MTKKPARKPTPRQPARDRTPRPILAMAAPPLDQCVVKIEKLRGAEPNYSITLPGHSLKKTVERALEQYRLLGLALIKVEVEYLVLRQAGLGAITPPPVDAAKIQAEVEAQAPAVFQHAPYPNKRAKTPATAQALEEISHTFPPRG